MMMKKCFSCLRRLKFVFRKKNENRKWLFYLESYCSTHHKNQWCDLLNEHFDEISIFQSATEETLKELRSTNISTEIIKTIRKQYTTGATPIKLITEIFTSYINRRYIDTVNPTKVTINKIKTDYDNFLEFMRSLTVIYYKLQERQLIGDDQFFKVTLSNFLIQCLFSCPNFQSCIFQIVRNSCKQSQDRIYFNMQKYQSYAIEQYGVNSKFCLNSLTLEQFKKQVHTPIVQKPYNGAIQFIRQIVKVRTPQQKIKCLQSITSQIEFSIKKFYNQYNIQDPIALDADNAIAILLYIIVQSNQSQLLTHINIIQNFMIKEGLSGTSEYCLATYKVCNEFLEKGNIRRCKGFMIPEQQFSLWINVRSYFQQNAMQKL